MVGPGVGVVTLELDGDGAKIDELLTTAMTVDPTRSSEPPEGLS